MVDFVEYEYPWLDAAIVIDGLRLASRRDIAAMKLAAVTNRGAKKDFIDLAVLLDSFSLSDMLTFYGEKYMDSSVFTVLKSLVFFDDAEDDPMPDMLLPVNGASVKERIEKAVIEVSSTS